MTGKRHKFQIYFQILDEIQRDYLTEGTVKPAHVSYKVGVPYVRLKRYLEEMEKIDIIDETLRITEKGERFLFEYGRMMDFLSRMGMLKFNIPLEISIKLVQTTSLN